MKASVVCSPSELDNRLFDPQCRDDVNNRNIILKKEMANYGIDLATFDINPIEESAFVIHFDSHAKILSKYQHIRTKRLLLVNESPIINFDNQSEVIRSHFDRILTWESNKIDNQKIFWLGCGCQAHLDFILGDNNNFESRGDLCFISGNKYSKHQNELYSAREEAIEFFSQSNLDLDMYGQGWDYRVFQGFLRPFNRMPPIVKKLFYRPPSSYRGSVVSKFETLKKYKFSICYENSRSTNGYISEKIFDAMFNGCIPIYWGAEDIYDFVSANTFIDIRKFDSYSNLETYLRSMTLADYESFLYAIQQFYPVFLKSSFHEKVWAETIVKHCLELI